MRPNRGCLSSRQDNPFTLALSLATSATQGQTPQTSEHALNPSPPDRWTVALATELLRRSESKCLIIALEARITHCSRVNIPDGRYKQKPRQEMATRREKERRFSRTEQPLRKTATHCREHRMSYRNAARQLLQFNQFKRFFWQ